MKRSLGASLILAAGFLLRKLAVDKYRNEEAVLQDLCSALLYLQEQVEMNLLPLPKLLQRGGELGIVFFQNILEIQKSSSSQNLENCWHSAVQNLPLDKLEQVLLIRLADSLNAEECSLIRAVKGAREHLQFTLQERKAKRAEKEKVASACCLYGSLLLLILLI